MSQRTHSPLVHIGSMAEKLHIAHTNWSLFLSKPSQIAFSCRLMALNTSIWYSERVGSSSHTPIKEERMPEPCTRHLPHSTALICIDIDHLGQPEALQHHRADIVSSDMTELGGRR